MSTKPAKSYLVRFCSAQEFADNNPRFPLMQIPPANFTHFMTGRVLESLKTDGHNAERHHIIELDNSMLIETTEEAISSIRKIDGIRSIERGNPNGPSAFIPPVHKRKVPGPGGR